MTKARTTTATRRVSSLRLSDPSVIADWVRALAGMDERPRRQTVSVVRCGEGGDTSHARVTITSDATRPHPFGSDAAEEAFFFANVVIEWKNGDLQVGELVVRIYEDGVAAVAVTSYDGNGHASIVQHEDGGYDVKIRS